MPPATDSTARSLDTAGWLAVEAERLAAEGRLGESERMLGRLLALQEQAVACKELDLAETLGMRGEVRFLSIDLPGAEEDFRRALAIRERCLGRRHTDTAGSLCSLALVLWRRGERTDAEPLLSRCLDIRRSLLGDDHPETRRTQSRLKRLWRELAGTEDDVATTEQDERMELVDRSSTAVVAEWTALRDRFGDLSRRLLDAARADRTTTPERVVRELNDCRLGFQRLCDEARGWAEAFQVPCPPDAQLENLLGIASFLDRIGEAVLQQEQAERPRRRGLLVLDQVLRLTHTLERDFAPLLACQDSAQALHRQLAAGVETDREELRPFYELLVLALQRKTLSDENWQRAHQSVSAAFGKSLAAAATRGHLIPSAAYVDDRDAGEPTTAAVLHPQFARPEEEYVIPLGTVPLLPVPAPPSVIGGPLSAATHDLGMSRHARSAAAGPTVRFRTADGKLYTLNPAEPVAGPKGLDAASLALPREQEPTSAS
ncbi:MAG: tetratricopeptide repeat protein [Isosphaeraceae bacterium]|nr:tetratricopeptide repeat protein [Isosphaeraceae bacterium]